MGKTDLGNWSGNISVFNINSIIQRNSYSNDVPLKKFLPHPDFMYIYIKELLVGNKMPPKTTSYPIYVLLEKNGTLNILTNEYSSLPCDSALLYFGKSVRGKRESGIVLMTSCPRSRQNIDYDFGAE